MPGYLGDYAEDATVYIPFNTYSSDDPQASVTITNLADGDLHVHKDAGTTQIVTDGATIAIDFDGITGNHIATIDTSAHADYSVGSDYMVRMEGTTVDGATINAWIGSFSIENRFDHDTAKASALATAQTDLDTLTGSDGATLATTQGNYAPNTVVPDAAGTAPTVGEITTELNSNLALAATALDLILKTSTFAVALASANWDRVLTGGTHNITNSSGKRLRQIEASFVVDSGTAQAGTATTITLASTANSTNDNIYRGDRITITEGTGVGEHDICISYDASTRIATMAETWIVTPDNTSVYEVSPASVDIETWQHNIVTASAGGLPDVNVNEVADTSQTAGDLAALIVTADSAIDAVATTIGAAGAGLTNINLPNQTMDIVGDITGNLSGSIGSNTELGPAEVNAECDTAISDAALATAANLATVDTNVDDLKLGIIFGAAEAGTLSTTQATSDLTGITNDQLIGRIITVTSGQADTESSAITDYASASGLLTFDAMTLAMEAADTFKIT